MSQVWIVLATSRGGDGGPMSPSRSDALVLFGAIGDLAQKNDRVKLAAHLVFEGRRGRLPWHGLAR